jgi:hypothetical protein
LPKKNCLTSLESHIDEEPTSLIARVRAAMPLIEANLRAGHSLRTVHQLLQQDGIAISYKLLALNRSRIVYPSATQEAESAAGREVSQLGTQITRKNLNVQPTVKIPAGYKFNIRVNRDMLFESPYQPAQPAADQDIARPQTSRAH